MQFSYSPRSDFNSVKFRGSRTFPRGWNRRTQSRSRSHLQRGPYRLGRCPGHSLSHQPDPGGQPAKPLLSISGLEHEFQCQLHDPARLCRLNHAEIRRANVVVRQAEVHIVEDVEELCPELQVHSLVDRNRLESRKIPLLKRWSAQRISPHISELPRRRWLKSSGVEPAIRRVHGRRYSIANARA
jgi:hypothetical protein